jgi:hypothetical protein
MKRGEHIVRPSSGTFRHLIFNLTQIRPAFHQRMGWPKFGCYARADKHTNQAHRWTDQKPNALLRSFHAAAREYEISSIARFT